MSRYRCRWVKDPDVPGGKFLVPGCMNRAEYGDDADCHCVGTVKCAVERDKIDEDSIIEKLDSIIERLDRLEARTALQERGRG